MTDYLCTAGHRIEEEDLVKQVDPGSRDTPRQVDISCPICGEPVDDD